jgi:hypothetical protein
MRRREKGFRPRFGASIEVMANLTFACGMGLLPADEVAAADEPTVTLHNGNEERK